MSEQYNIILEINVDNINIIAVNSDLNKNHNPFKSSDEAINKMKVISIIKETLNETNFINNIQEKLNQQKKN